jgi:hypothetical protein
MSLRADRLAEHITGGQDAKPHVTTVTGRVGPDELRFHALTRADDSYATMDGLTKGFQRIKLPAPMASAIPGSLLQFQREATTETDAPGLNAHGANAQALQQAIGKAVRESVSAPILAKDPERTMASWDSADTLRIHLVGMGGGSALLRQSSVLSQEETPGAATAAIPHTDMAPVSVERRVRQQAANQLGCSPGEALLYSVDATILHTARLELGVSADDVSDSHLMKLAETGALTCTRVWMSPNSAAQPLAFLDCATVDYEKYLHGDTLIRGFERVDSTPDYTKPHAMSSWPKDKKIGQIQLAYQPDAGHKWYYFHDLSEQEALAQRK